jgi:hypothetical protein
VLDIRTLLFLVLPFSFILNNMLLYLTIVLIASSAALALLLYAKHWELTTGRMLLPGVRPHLESASQRMLSAIERHLPMALARMLGRLGLWLRIRARDLLARLIITVETTLQAILDHLKHGLSPSKGSSAAPSSAFLREVAEHKRKLTRVTRVRRTSAVDSIAAPEAD